MAGSIRVDTQECLGVPSPAQGDTPADVAIIAGPGFVAALAGRGVTAAIATTTAATTGTAGVVGIVRIQMAVNILELVIIMRVGIRVPSG